MQLSENFRLEEFTTSPTAIANGYDNRASVAVVANLKALCENVLQPLRNHFNKPVKITSGYRCLALNRKLNSKDSSQHRTGNAADLIIPGVPLQEVFDYIRTTLPYDQLLLETNKKGSQWIHVSYLPHGYNCKQAIDNFKA